MTNGYLDPVREALFYEIHQALEARLAILLEGLRQDETGSAELLRLSVSEAWIVTRYKADGPGYCLRHTDGAPVLDAGTGVHDWQRRLLRIVTNTIILHVDSVLVASDALGIPGLLQTYAVRRVMES